jgi:hypothetical protein
MLIMAIVFLLLFFINVPYGRYTSRSWGFLVNAKFMWFAMEFPVSIFHFLFWATRRASAVPTHVLVPLFEMRDPFQAPEPRNSFDSPISEAEMSQLLKRTQFSNVWWPFT